MEQQPVTIKSLVDKSPYLDLKNDLRQTSLSLKQKYASNYQSQSLGREGAPVDLPKRPFYCPFTKNRKFEIFLEDLFDLGFENDRIKQEILQYVSALEAYYAEKLRDVYLRRDKNRSKSQMGNIETQKVNALMQKNELMSILDDSVEEVKKQIMRRRAKQEAEYSSRKSTLDQGASEQVQFEISMMKLVDYARNKIKYTDFTQADKYNMVDMFVNNATTY